MIEMRKTNAATATDRSATVAGVAQPCALCGR